MVKSVTVRITSEDGVTQEDAEIVVELFEAY